MGSMGINEERTQCLDSSPLAPLILTRETKRDLMMFLIL